MHFLSEAGPETKTDNQTQAELMGDTEAESIQKTTEKAVQRIPAPEEIKEWPEPKSKRFQILLQPSLYDALKAEAYNQRTSINELIHSTLWDKINGQM